jgi:uncharacterized CHY-type Zn-finger protein
MPDCHPLPNTPRPEVYGLALDPATRCQHWHSSTDIIAIRMACCNKYYACYECHAALAGHPAQPWPRAAFDTPAVLCGACGAQLTIRAYLESHYRCPACAAEFNPRCELHYPLYFDVPEK